MLQEGHSGSSVTGEHHRCVNSPATAASVMLTPSSTVRQMVSASRLAVAFKAGPGVSDARCENLHRHTPQDPYILCLTASPANQTYALRIRKGRFNYRDDRNRKYFDKYVLSTYVLSLQTGAYPSTDSEEGMNRRLVKAVESIARGLGHP